MNTNTTSVIPDAYTPILKLSSVINGFKNTKFFPFIATIKGSEEMNSVYMNED